jgi:hypothetical protein
MKPFAEYQKISNMISNKNGSFTKEDIYNELMKKEQNVLNTVNRVAEQQTRLGALSDSYLKMDVDTLIQKFFETWSHITHEIILMATNQRSFSLKSVILLFTEGERMFYVGVMLVMLSFILFLINIS